MASGMTELVRPDSSVCISIIGSRIHHPSQKTGLRSHLPQPPCSSGAPQSSEGHETLDALLLADIASFSRGRDAVASRLTGAADKNPAASYLCESWTLLGKTRVSLGGTNKEGNHS